MAEITAGMVKELRELTGLGMMECKKALTEAGGDLEEGRGAAAHQERRQGEQGGGPRRRRRRRRRLRVAPTASSARWSRSTARPTSSPRTTTSSRSRAALAELRRARESGRRGSAVRRSRSTAQTVEERAPGAGAEDRREHDACAASRASRRKGKLAHYVHGGSKIGVLVDVDGGDETLGKDLAMHIAAPSRVACRKDQVPAELIAARARHRCGAGAPESGKPPNIVDKMVEGGVQKFLDGSHAARPAVREGRQADGREAARRRRARRSHALHAVRGRRGHREEDAPISRPK